MNALPFQLTELQWALLIFGLIVVLLVIILSLRRGDKGGNVKTDARGSRVIAQPRVEEPSTYGITGEFDEFGVGRPRRRGDARPAQKIPQLNIEPGPVRAAPAPEKKMPSYMTAPAATVTPVAAAARRVAPTIAPIATPPPAAPERSPQMQTAPMAAPTPGPAMARKGDEKIVTLLVARNSAMNGPKIHAALAACGLSFGPMQIYHRKHEGKRVFSVASLMKPGFLIPEDADGFSTMALSVFMVLPGPVEAQAAFEDLLKTAQRLADALEAQVYDDRRQPLSSESADKLRSDIKSWAARASA
jgi:cell division protein ZipA